ncbi:hypothetical protein NBRC116596_02440 [Litorivita sp. NS0012-18]
MAKAHGTIRAPDHVPQNAADAQNVMGRGGGFEGRIMAHGSVMPRGAGLRKMQGKI